ncbi:MAG: nuclear transport factor 2 family protein [Myxococcota bacterium]
MGRIGVWMTVVFVLCCSVHASADSGVRYTYENRDPELFKALAEADKRYFDAYNRCDLDTQRSMLAEDFEFYHDGGGLNRSRDDVIAAIKQNVCGRISRVLFEGNLEAYPIPGHGAVLMGLHAFKDTREPGRPLVPSRFIGVWVQEEGVWKLSRVISLH